MESSSPKRAGLVLAALILVAGGRQPQPRGRQRRPAGHRQGLRRRPDDARPDRGRLLARARRLGPLPRRARRPLRAQDDAAARHGAVDPGLAARRASPPRVGVLFVARLLGGVAAGMAFPTTLALITALWSGAGADPLDRALVGARRRDLRARAAALRRPAGAASTGARSSSSPLPLAVARPLPRLALRPRPRQRDDRAGRQPRRHPLDRCWSRRWCWRSTSRRCPARARWRSASASSPLAAGGAFVLRQRRVALAALRPRRRRAGGSSGSRPAPGSSSSAR